MKKFLFYVLNLTWGLPMTFIGALVALILLIAGHKPKRHGGCIYFAVGKSWGGLELGLFFLTDKHEALHTRNHEFGHALQNCLWGPLMPFVISIPSAVRYWWRRWRAAHGKTNPPYDSIWFEGQASRLGYEYIKFFS